MDLCYEVIVMNTAELVLLDMKFIQIGYFRCYLNAILELISSNGNDAVEEQPEPKRRGRPKKVTVDVTHEKELEKYLLLFKL